MRAVVAHHAALGHEVQVFFLYSERLCGETAVCADIGELKGQRLPADGQHRARREGDDLAVKSGDRRKRLARALDRVAPGGVRIVGCSRRRRGEGADRAVFRCVDLGLVDAVQSAKQLYARVQRHAALHRGVHDIGIPAAVEIQHLGEQQKAAGEPDRVCAACPQTEARLAQPLRVADGMKRVVGVERRVVLLMQRVKMQGIAAADQGGVVGRDVMVAVAALWLHKRAVRFSG